MSKARQDHELGEILSELCEGYPNLAVPPEATLATLQRELTTAERRIATERYMTVTAAALVTLFVTPLLMQEGFESARSIGPILLATLRPVSCFKPSRLSMLPLVAGCTAPPFYTLVMHRLPVRFLPKGLRNIDRRDWRFVIYATAANYLSVGALILLSSGCDFLSSGVVEVAVLAWLCVPLLFLSFLPLFVAPPITLALIGSYRQRVYKRAPQAATLREIYLLLRSMIDLSDSGEIPTQKKVEWMERIENISGMIRGLFSKDPQLVSAQLATRRIGRSADYFLSLSSYVTIPRAESLCELKKAIADYAAIFAVGTYDALPTYEGDDIQELARQLSKRGTLRLVRELIGLFATVSVPLLLYSTMVFYALLDVPPALYPALWVLYSFWVILAVVVHLDALAPQARSSLIEAVKLVLGR